MPTLLETDRIRFQAHRESDLAKFVAMQADPEFRRYVAGRPWSAEEVESRFEERFRGKPEGSLGLFAAELKETWQYVGYCGLYVEGEEEARPIESATLAFNLGREFWGRGLGTEAATAFIAYEFRDLGLNRIRASLTRGNAASERILRKLGFSLVRSESLPERVLDHYLLRAPGSSESTNRHSGDLDPKWA